MPAIASIGTLIAGIARSYRRRGSQGNSKTQH
jgi:hypothetical protein